MMRKILGGVILGIIAILLIAPFVYAVPAAVTNFTANPSNTSIILTWKKGVGATSTVINYSDNSTTGFPAAATDPIIIYNGTGFQTTLSGLTAGTVYYFSAWAFDGAYSGRTTLAVATLAAAIPNGGEATDTVIIPTKSLAGLNSAPAPTGFNFEPFTSIIHYFNDTPNGLGMPMANVAETLTVLGIVVLGIMVYVQSRNFFIGYAVVLALSIVGVGLRLLQGYIVGVEVIIGAGVWAIDNYFQ